MYFDKVLYILFSLPVYTKLISPICCQQFLFAPSYWIFVQMVNYPPGKLQNPFKSWAVKTSNFSNGMDHLGICELMNHFYEPISFWCLLDFTGIKLSAESLPEPFLQSD